MKKIILIILMLAATAFGQAIYQDDVNNFVSFYYYENLDSAWAYFYLDNTANQVDSVKLMPAFSTPDKTVWADSFSLDLSGTYGVKVEYFVNGGSSAFYGTTAINTKDLSVAGTDNEACTLLIVDDSGVPGSPIAGARAWLYNLAQTHCYVSGALSNVLGKTFVWLDSASFVLVINSNNQQQYIDTITVNKDSTWNITMTTFSPSAPVRAGGCVLYGWTADITGDTLVGAKFTVTPVTNNLNWVDSAGIVVSVKTETDLTDANGYFELEVYRSDYLTGQNWNGTATTDTLKYNIELTKSGYSTYKLINQYITADSTRIGD